MALNIAPIPMPKSGMEAFEDSRAQSIKNRLLQAQTEREQAKANLPFGGIMPPGAAGQTVGLEMLKYRYGENSPQYQEAKNLYDLNKRSMESRVNYQNILSGTAPKRFSTPMGKTVHELEDIKKGYLPGTEIKTTPEQQEQLSGQYGLDILKKTTDESTRKRNIFSKNIDITLNSIDPKSLTQYSGAKGAANRLEDEVRSGLLGQKVPRYEAYTNALSLAELLKDQVTQFYGKSISEQSRNKLNKLINPATLMKSPETALANFKAFIKVLNKEQETSQKALQSPDIYNPEKRKTKKLPLSHFNKEKESEGSEPSSNTNKENKFSSDQLTDENIIHTAQELGISVPEVIEELRKQGYEIKDDY